MGYFHTINAYEDGDGNIVLDAPFSFEATSYDMMSMEILMAPLDRVRDMMVREDAVWPSLRFTLPISDIPEFSGKPQLLKSPGTVETPENGLLGQRMGHLFPSKLACHSAILAALLSSSGRWPIFSPNHLGHH